MGVKHAYRPSNDVIAVWCAYLLFSLFSPNVLLANGAYYIKFIALALGLSSLSWLLLRWPLRDKSWFALSPTSDRKISVSCRVLAFTSGLALLILCIDQFVSVPSADAVQISVPVIRTMCTTAVGTKTTSLRSSEVRHGKYCFWEQPSFKPGPIKQWDVPPELIIGSARYLSFRNIDDLIMADRCFFVRLLV